MMCSHCDGVAIGDAQVSVDSDLCLGLQLVTDPPHADLLDRTHPFHTCEHVPDVLHEPWIHGVDQSMVDVHGDILQDRKNCHRYQKTHHRVGQPPACGNAETTQDHGKRGQTIGPGVK